MTENTYDAIVIGGGHNGLVNAAYLARGGLRTVVLEQRHLVGGAAITEELHPGFSFTTFSYALSLLRPQVVEELELPRHGFAPLEMPTSFAPTTGGDHLLMGEDTADNLRQLDRLAPGDADGYLRYQHDLHRVVELVRPLMDRVPPNLFGSSTSGGATTGSGADAALTEQDGVDVAWLMHHLRGADRRVLLDLVRLVTGSAADFLDHYLDGELVKGWLSSSGTIGSSLGPMSPGSGLVLLYHCLGEHDGRTGSWSFHQGGNGGFTQVLARAAEAHGVQIRLESRVDRVLTDGDRATGVVLVDGTELHAPVVVSSLDPRQTFTRLVAPQSLPTDLVDAVQRLRFTGVSAKVNFALDGPPHYPALAGRSDQFRGFVNIGPSMEYLERAFDASKYGWYSERPFIDCALQSFVDPGMAPPGKHVLSCFVQYAPYRLRGGENRGGNDWDAQREPFGDVVQATMSEFFPGFDDLVLHREVVTPLDIERVTGLSEGNIFGGELFAQQLYFMRPAPGWAGYRTPIRGYYQCGSGTHPGGCVTGGPGRLAGQVILTDRTTAT